MNICQISFIFTVALLGMFVFSCGQFNTKDEGLDSKSIEEASGVSSGSSSTDNSSGGTTATTAGFVISAITGSTTESGGTATFTVNLKSQPTANVSFALSSSDSTEGSVSPASLIFNSSNWSTAQTVTVTGIDDSTIDGNKSYTILLGIASSSDSNYSGLDPSDVSVTNTDDETAGFTISSISDNTTESGGSTTFTAKLNSQPSADVSIAVSSSDTTEGTVSPSSLVFTSSNWSSIQSVIITGADDSLDDGNQSYTVLLGVASSSDSNYNNLDPTDISVINTDDDTAGFTVSSISGVTTEYGGTSTFTIKLNSQPTADVSIAVSSSDTTEGTVSTASLTFTATNWTTTQTVTATGVNDSAVDGNQSYTIILGAASSSDSNYKALDPADVSVTNTDDETAGITVSSISGNTTEAGGTATFTVKLTSQPSANVIIAVSSSNTTEGTVSPSSLTFTNSNWTTAQTVTINGIDDNLTDGNQNFTIVLATATSSDSNYNGLNPSDVLVTNYDDEWSGVKQFGSSANDSPEGGIVIDSSGNVYVSGSTWGGLDGNTNAGGGVSGDIFLIKYNLAGVKQWTKQLGTSVNDSAYSVDLDTSGDIYVTGITTGGLDGNSNAGSNSEDIFLLKYNSSGVKQWTKQLGTSSNDYALDAAIDSDSNIYVTGYTKGGLDGNSYTGETDIFLLKYNSNGVKQWVKQIGTSASDSGYGVTVDSSNNIYVTGSTGAGLDGNTHLGGSDIFLLKYNSSGAKQWSKQLGTSLREWGSGVIVDSTNDIYVVGQTLGDLDGNTNTGNNDLFIVKYNSSGTKQWTQQLGTSSTEDGLALIADSSGNIYATGTTSGGLDGNTNVGLEDIILVKYNSSGTKLWVKQLGTNSTDIGTDLALGIDGSIFMTGYTYGGLDGNTNFGSGDVFIVKYNYSGVKQ